MTENYLGKNCEENEEDVREKKWAIVVVLAGFLMILFSSNALKCVLFQGIT